VPEPLFPGFSEWCPGLSMYLRFEVMTNNDDTPRARAVPGLSMYLHFVTGNDGIPCQNTMPEPLFPGFSKWCHGLSMYFRFEVMTGHDGTPCQSLYFLVSASGVMALVCIFALR